MTRLLQLLLALPLLASLACDDPTTIRTCTNAQVCVCEQEDVCDFSCQGAGCAFVCRDNSSCILTCDGGGCDAQITTTIDAEFSCAGGGCTLNCQGTGSCTLYDCTQGCALECSEDSVCTNTCTDPTCSRSRGVWGGARHLLQKGAWHHPTRQRPQHLENKQLLPKSTSSKDTRRVYNKKMVPDTISRSLPFANSRVGLKWCLALFIKTHQLDTPYGDLP